MDQVAKKTNDDALKIFKKAIENLKPLVEVKTRRVGGANYQVPTQVNSRRQQALAIRWILEACREKKGRPMHQLLGEELMAAYRREGAAMTKRDNVHRMADANKAFAHFAW
jgi:small subunit ribosomal protein S7